MYLTVVRTAFNYVGDIQSKSKMKNVIIYTLLTVGFLNSSLLAKDGDPDISPQKRLEAVSRKLNANNNEVAVYVKGLVCSSCSIGVKVKLRKLKGVDKSRFEKGVKLDVQSQIALVALKEGAVIDSKLLAKAVADAGYEAGSIFTLQGNKVKETKL